MSDEQQQNQQNENGKVAKKFANNMRKLVALMSGEALFKKPKLDSPGIEEALQELVKDEKEDLIKKFKEEAKKLITRKQEFDTFCKQQEKQMEQAILDKKKEFNKEFNSLFSIVERIEEIEKNYYQTMKSMSDSPTEQGTSENDQEEIED